MDDRRNFGGHFVGIRHKFAVLAFLVLTSVYASAWVGRPALAGPVSPQKQQQIVREYTAGLERTEERFATGRILGTWTSETKVGQPSYKREVTIVVLERIGNKEMKYTQVLPPNEANPDQGSEQVAATDGENYFFLERKASSKEYAIRAVANAAKKDNLDVKVARGFRYINSLFKYGGISTKTLINDPGFVIENLAEFAQDGDKLLKIDFSIAEKPGSITVKSGSITVMPQEGWLLREFVAQMGGKLSGFSNHLTVQYQRNLDGVLLPKTFVDTRDPDYKHTFEIDNLSFEAPSKRIFTLASYGFPDLNAPATKSRGDGVSTLLFSLAFAALLGAVVVAYRAGRRRVVANG